MRCIVAALFALLTVSVATAGGPLRQFVCGTTPPVKYAGPITLNFDLGTLGTRTKAQADALVLSAAGIWSAVPTTTVRFVKGPDLPVDVTAASYNTYRFNPTDGLTPVIYDTDGSIVDTFFGVGAKDFILGSAGSYVGSSGSTCFVSEGEVLINGYIALSDSQLGAVLAHELGHLAGVDHTQLDGGQGLYGGSIPLMYPIAERGVTTLHEDDAAAITGIYPSTTVATVYGQLTGTFVASNGTTPIQGTNLWAREIYTNKHYSIVSDYLKQGTGYFKLLLPPGRYTLHAEAIQMQFRGGSGVGPFTGNNAEASSLAPNYVGGVAMTPLTLGNGTPTVIAINAGCAASLTFRFDGTGSVTGNCTAPNTVPTPPVIGAATPGNAQASVSFSPPLSNGGSAVTGYTATCGGISVNGTASPIAVTGLINGTATSCAVRARNALGPSLPSEDSNLITPFTLPGAPTIFSVVAGNSQVTVYFSSPSNDGGSPITGYVATCGAANATSPYSPYPATPNPLVVTGLANGVAVTCAVRALNAAGTGLASAASSPVTPSTVPGAPTNVVATAGNTQLSLTFAAPTSNGGSAITGYVATCGAATGSGVSAPIIVGSLINGSAVTCTVRAINGNGAGPPSLASNLVTPATVPAAPAISAVTAGNARVTVAFTAPANNGGIAITGYAASCGTVTVNGSASPITVVGLVNGTSVTCTVRASNGIGSSAPSAPSIAVTPSTLPGAPTIGVAVAGNARVTVAFIPPVSNGGDAITSYFAICGTSSATGNASPIVVTGAVNGAATTCLVRANNGNGAGPFSGASNRVTPVLCALDFSGDGTVNATDALIFNRWLLGQRGDTLVSGITPVPVGTSVATYAAAVTARMVLGQVHDFDDDGRVSPFTDGLLFLRLASGMPTTSVTTGVLGTGAKRTAAADIRANMNTNCGTSF